MGIGIDNASVGYDTVGLQDYIQKINIEVIGEIIKTMNQTIPRLRESADAVWAGQACDAFKAKLEKDSDEMVKTLENLKEMVEGEMAQIAQNIDSSDAAIAESIKNFD